MSIWAITAVVGCLAENWTASSVATYPRLIDLSRYMTEGTGWKPTAGPLVRISIFTPVSGPWETRGPVTRFFSASML